MQDKVLLIVDDDQMVLRSAARMLRKRWTVITAGTVEDALKLMPSAHIILTDWDMPAGGGAAVLAAAKAPVVVWTGNPDVRTTEEREQMKAAASVIAKPAVQVEVDTALYQALKVVR